MDARPTNAFTVDLEEWHHPHLVAKHIREKKSLIEEATRILLSLLDRHGVSATFFVTGEVAAEKPQLIREIARRGHEIACHGFSHRTLHDLGPREFRNELSEFRKTLGAIPGCGDIKGFRAPGFSLTPDTRWAVDILKESGFTYDSSIFPMRIHGRYGAHGAPQGIYGISARDICVPDPASSLKEFPAPVFTAGPLRMPATGGFYLRLLPLRLQNAMLKAINRSRPFVLYVHPWECDPDTPRVRLNPFARFISYHNLGSSLGRLEYLLKEFHFGRIDKLLERVS